MAKVLNGKQFCLDIASGASKWTNCKMAKKTHFEMVPAANGRFHIQFEEGKCLSSIGRVGKCLNANTWTIVENRKNVNKHLQNLKKMCLNGMVPKGTVRMVGSIAQRA